MAEIQKLYVQRLPSVRFIGKRFGDEDRVDGSFSVHWENAFLENGLLSQIEPLAADGAFEDSDAFIGLMRAKDGEPFSYFIGMFCPAETPVPEGMDSIDFDSPAFGVGWVYGAEDDVYCHEMDVAQQLSAAGYPPQNASDGALWCFERYACPRFTTPDEKGNIILDIGFLVNPD